MKILIINGSPRKNGTIDSLLKSVAEGISGKHDIEYIYIYDHNIRPCTACMKCRTTGSCILPEDGGHRIGNKLREADALVIGTPVHWGNMSSQLKIFFDRNVPVFMGESRYGFPVPRQKGKPAVIVTACSTPWPFNFIAAESRGAVKAVKEVLHYGGYKIKGIIVKPGSKKNPVISDRLLKRAKKAGIKLGHLLDKKNREENNQHVNFCDDRTAVSS